jgi:hypothetical protein
MSSPIDGSGPKPITRQRSSWRQLDHPDIAALVPDALVYERNVHDGALIALVAEEPLGWHLSISHRTVGARRAPRYPSWDELADARYSLLPSDRDFVMHLPPPGEYVAVHDTCFHLHEHPERSR